MATKWYHKTQIIIWVVVIAVTIAIGAFIFISPLIPDKYRLWLGVLDYALFTYANFAIVRLRNLDRKIVAKENENRAARRQAERLKNKQS